MSFERAEAGVELRLSAARRLGGFELITQNSKLFQCTDNTF
jgi:hypothetical protein